MVLLLLLELLLLVVVHARVVLERGAAGPDHGGPVEGAAASAAGATPESRCGGLPRRRPLAVPP